ncbi:hypothetical protein D8S85_19400 [Butyricimonas faecalis]|uniref:Uncharacterized protein n=1 Tax=Butyricimonas faecalis TaxID=2093856 RepID=A0A3S9VY78_9BACT|nr:hypothetical protein D8S85_19400 [Butyricimonas faecalis]
MDCLKGVALRLEQYIKTLQRNGYWDDGDVYSRVGSASGTYAYDKNENILDSIISKNYYVFLVNTNECSYIYTK